MPKKVYLGPDAVMFGNSDCPACLSQVKLIKDNLKFGEIVYYDLKKFPAPDFITDKTGGYSMPTWVMPDGKVHKGVIADKRMFGKLVKKRTSRFGSEESADIIPQLGVLAKYGKDFPNGKGMEIPNSFMNQMQDKWGHGEYDVLNAGTVGRELGPNRTDEIYTQKYYNQPRMAEPAGQLGTALRLNRLCNIVNNPAAKLEVPGMFPDSKNQGIVGFGNRKRKSNFGNLYSQMGPAYGSQYLIDKNTVKNLYGGGIQDNLPRPYKVNNPGTFIGSYPEYNPLSKNFPFNKSSNKASFGLKEKKSKKRVIKEGTVLTVKGNKIKVKN